MGTTKDIVQPKPEQDLSELVQVEQEARNLKCNLEIIESLSQEILNLLAYGSNDVTETNKEADNPSEPVPCKRLIRLKLLIQTNCGRDICDKIESTLNEIIKMIK